MSIYVEKKPWWGYLPNDLKEALKLSLHLADESAKWSKTYHDYSFVVFPAAKAYEGFLKKIFLDMKFIDKRDYYGKHFRIGKSLNPQLEDRYKGDDWVYEKLTNYCKSSELPEKLWKTWKEARNIVFHWFPEEKNVVTHNEATEKVLMIISAIDEVFKACEIDLNGKSTK